MKKLIIIVVSMIFTASVAFSLGINLKRKSCDAACDTAKKECYKDAEKDKKDVQVKKKACDVAQDKCIDKCRKEYGY